MPKLLIALLITWPAWAQFTSTNATRLRGRMISVAAPADGQCYVWSVGANQWQPAACGGGGGSAAWGSITGTLSNQTDLNSALALKAPLVSPVFTSPSLGTSYLSTSKTAGTSGTTASTLCKIDSTGNVVTEAVAGVGVLGVCVTTQTSGQPVEVATRGIINCIADNTTVVGHIAIVGTATGGRCRDSGQTDSTTISIATQVVGKFLSVATVGNPASIQLYGPGHYGMQLTGSCGIMWLTPRGNGFTQFDVCGGGLGVLSIGDSIRAAWQSSGFGIGDGIPLFFNTAGKLTTHWNTALTSITTGNLSGCGTGVTVDANANDQGGTLTFGTAPGTCVITFNATYTTNPKCIVTFQSGVLGTYAHNATTITIGATGLTGAVDWQCSGN